VDDGPLMSSCVILSDGIIAQDALKVTHPYCRGGEEDLMSSITKSLQHAPISAVRCMTLTK